MVDVTKCDSRLHCLVPRNLLYGNYRQLPSTLHQGLPPEIAANPLTGKDVQPADEVGNRLRGFGVRVYLRASNAASRGALPSAHPSFP